MTAQEPRMRIPSPEAGKSDPMQVELAELLSQLDTLKASREAEAASDPVLKFQVVARAEMALFHIRAQRVAGRSTLFIVAMALGVLALGMLDFAAFSAMAPSQGPALAALYMALGNAVAAVLFILAARKAGPKESHEKLALEIRDLAYTELNRDFEQVQTELQHTVEEVRQLRSSVQSVDSMIGFASKLTTRD